MSHVFILCVYIHLDKALNLELNVTFNEWIFYVCICVLYFPAGLKIVFVFVLLYFQTGLST